MTSLQSALGAVVAEVRAEVDEVREAVAEWLDSTTEVTAVVEKKSDPLTISQRQRVREDGRAEQIILRRLTGEGSGEARFVGDQVWELADMMLTGWMPKKGTADVSFTVQFTDGEIYAGQITIAPRRRPSLATHCKSQETFRRSFCKGLDDKRAGALFRFFLTHYQIGPSTPDA